MGYIKEQIKAMSKEYGSTAKAKSASTKWFSESMPAKDAERLYRLSQRQGYGVCKGMKSN